jgi:hypothetical protein
MAFFSCIFYRTFANPLYTIIIFVSNYFLRLLLVNHSIVFSFFTVFVELCSKP